MASRLQDVIIRDTRANQPGATTVAIGTLYFVIDESVTERSNGTIWQSYSGAAGINQLTGDVTAGPGFGSQATTIPNNTVTYAKMQDVTAASRLIGRGSAAGAGDPQEILLGNGLLMSSTTLKASGDFLVIQVFS